MFRRVVLHVLFWLVYLSLNVYIEYALVNYSFFDLPFADRLFKSLTPEISILPIKIALTYLIMYLIIPQHLEKRQYFQMGLKVLVLMVIALFIYRLLVANIIFPFVYEETYQQQPFSKLIPRHIFTGLDFFSIVGIAGMIKMTRLRLASAAREKQLMEEKLQSELNFLRAQTNPHFLFNTLNNIYALARKQSEQTADVVLRLSKILRFMLYECATPRITLAAEVKVIKDYIELEKLRYNQRLSVSFEENIDESFQDIAPLLLLPFVENAFKHGVSENRFDSQIHIQLVLKEKQLSFKISNSKEEEEEGSPGIGLSNIKRQLELIYPGQYQLQLKEEANKFSVNLQLNLAEDDPV